MYAPLFEAILISCCLLTKADVLAAALTSIYDLATSPLYPSAELSWGPYSIWRLCEVTNARQPVIVRTP